jgi:hypothetical protein
MQRRILLQDVSHVLFECFESSYSPSLDVGEDVENCILRLLQAAEYDVARAEYVSCSGLGNDLLTFVAELESSTWMRLTN